jgi:hypothetical protein
MKAERHFRTAKAGERYDLVLAKVDAWNELIGVVEITGAMTVSEIEKQWYKYSIATNNEYADYQSFMAGFNLQKGEK